MRPKVWIVGWLIMVISILGLSGWTVYKVDPYFHYHAPLTDYYFYTLDSNNQRSINDGLCRHLEYDAIITGTSMVENCSVEEMNMLFGCNAIKIPFGGGSYKEVNDNLDRALKANEKIRIVVRGLDMVRFTDKWNDMWEWGDFPTYIYDDNPLNDVEYLFNKNVIFGEVYEMCVQRETDGFSPGITPFDNYSRWGGPFGISHVYPDGVSIKSPQEFIHLSEQEKLKITENVNLNVTDLADKYPDVDFYYFYTPYSIAWWSQQFSGGTIVKQLEAERLITQLIVQHDNIHLFSFNCRKDIITDLNNYRADSRHYARWINSMILKWISEGEYQLTKDNYEERIDEEYNFLTTFDYTSVAGQKDYEADVYAGALLNNELTHAIPIDVLSSNTIDLDIRGGSLDHLDDGKAVINCTESFARDKSITVANYLKERGYVGAKFEVDLDGGINYLVFDGQLVCGKGSLEVFAFSSDGEIVGKIEINSDDLDNDIHQYGIDLSAADGEITVIMNGGYMDGIVSDDSIFQFSNVTLY